MKLEATLTINPIRFNWHYVIWYKNVTVILISLILPFILLAYWNMKTVAVMVRRRRLKNRPSLISNNTLRAVSENQDTPNHNVAAALLNIPHLMPANIVACSTSRQGN